MKSFVCEAQSVSLAIEKAWIGSGRPVIFSVKIIDSGRNTFFWWHKKPAKIIFFYELPGDNNVYSDDIVKKDLCPIIPGVVTVANKNSRNKNTAIGSNPNVVHRPNICPKPNVGIRPSAGSKPGVGLKSNFNINNFQKSFKKK